MTVYYYNIYIDIWVMILKNWKIHLYIYHIQSPNQSNNESYCNMLPWIMYTANTNSICAQHLSKFFWLRMITILYKESTVMHDVNLMSRIYITKFVRWYQDISQNQNFFLNKNECNAIIYIRGNIIRGNILQ